MLKAFFVEPSHNPNIDCKVLEKFLDQILQSPLSDKIKGDVNKVVQCLMFIKCNLDAIAKFVDGLTSQDEEIKKR